MTKFTSLVCSLVLIAACLTTAPLRAQAPAATPSARAEVVTPLNEAEALLIAKKSAEALEKVAQAEKAMNRNAYENFLIERVRASVALGAGDDAMAYKALVATIESGLLNASETPKFHDVITRVAFRNKDYANAILWANRTMALPDANPDLRLLLANSHYLSKDYAATIKVLAAHVVETEASGAKVNEDRYRMLAASANQIKDDKTYLATLEKLAIHYPKTDYWRDLIYRTQSSAGFGEKRALDVYRLKLATGVMSQAGDYLDMATLLSATGLLAEAQKVIDAALAAGKWGGGADEGRAKQVRESVARDLKDEQGRAPSTTKTSVAYLNNGMDQVVKGQAQRGLDLIEQGLKLADPKRAEEAKLRLGIAHVFAGNRAKAEEIFSTTQGSEGITALARAWWVFARSGSR